MSDVHAKAPVGPARLPAQARRGRWCRRADGTDGGIAAVARAERLLRPFTTNLGNLFILDTAKKTVWIYWNSQYDQPPEEAFVAGFPIENAVDLAVDKTDIYLLHADGHTTFCVYSDLSVSPSNCTDPAPYIDSRPGYENQVLIPEKAFSQLLATLPPDPSLYYLEPAGQALYRFSLRLLTYYGQYLPRPGSISSSALAPKPATAFTLSPDGRLAFLAISNQVYYAGMP